MTRRGSGFLLATLAALAIAPACGGSSASAQQVVAGAPAGDVTEISGDVHATRDGKTRAIAKGDVVSGDDVISTGGDGRVTIVLRHNHVPWVLGPNKEKKVADSAAWNAAAGASGEQVTDDHSTAAGRHAERSATDTGVSATTTAPAAPTAPTAPTPTTEETPPPVAAAQPPPPDMQPPAPPEPPPRTTRRAPSEPAAPPAPSGKNGPTTDDLTAALGDSGSMAGAPGGGSISGLRSGGGIAVGGTGSVGGMRAPDNNGPTPRLTIGEIESSGGLDTATASRILRGRSGALRACYQRALQQNPSLAGLLDVQLDVGPTGAVTGVTIDGPPELSDTEACMKRMIQALRFPTADDTSHVSAKIVLAPVSP
jgi:hypothetical protein